MPILETRREAVRSSLPLRPSAFEDLGLVLKVTPHIHGTDEVTLDVNAEFKLLGAASVDGIPVISSRKYESKTRVMTGEWAVLAGLMTSSEARTITGITHLEPHSAFAQQQRQYRLRPDVNRP